MTTVVLLVIVMALGCALTGCVTSKKYRLAKASTPAAQPMNLNVVAAPVEFTLTTVIVFKGPGSWKREARWDEYIVSLINRGEQSVMVESVELTDLLGQARVPGIDPWKLEKLSRTNWDKYGKTGLKLVAGVGAAAVYSVALVGVAEASAMGATGGGVAVLGAIPVIGLVDVSAVAVMNHQNKRRVQDEFRRRRLNLPCAVAPGESKAGSFFFPMTPGPKQLILRGHDGDRPLEVVLELKLLAGLHLKTAK